MHWVFNIVVDKAMMVQAILVRSMKVLRLKSPKGSIFALRSSCIKLMHCSSLYSVQAIINMHGTMKEICLFFNLSPKRQAELEKNIKEKGDSKRKMLVNLCKTCWVARIEAYESFSDLLPAVVSTMESISIEAGWNTDRIITNNSIILDSYYSI